MPKELTSLTDATGVVNDTYENLTVAHVYSAGSFRFSKRPGAVGATGAAGVDGADGADALAQIDRYTWSYNAYDQAAVIPPQKIAAAGTVTAMRITCATAPTGSENWKLYIEGADTGDFVVLADSATERDYATTDADTVTAGDVIYVDPTSAPSVVSTYGTITIEVTRT